MTRIEAFRAAVTQLRAAGVPDPSGDARRLMRACLSSETALRTDPDRELDGAEAERFGAMVRARSARQPVSQIVGERDFYGRRFTVTPAVLDPRPDTETLVDLALAGSPARRILDLGTGSGAILLTLLAEWPKALGTGTDISPEALAVARINAAALDLEDRVELCLADWFDGVEGRFDLVVSNPPYIAADEMAALSPEVRDWEPAIALSPGRDGLDAYRALSRGLDAVLRPGGRALFEIGAGQAAAVSALFSGALPDATVSVHHDINGKARVVAVTPG
ncbi:MAG: peptide chain release factor N(5)-glutamine methyltransferase [Rubricella sp.]